MANWKFWALLTVASVSVAVYVTWLDSGFQGDLFASVLPFILGSTISLVLVPAVVVGFIVLVAKLFKRAVPKGIVFILSGLIWLLVVTSTINVSEFEQYWQSRRAVEFSPEGCEYSVSFPSTPDKYTVQKATADGTLIPLYGAQLDVDGGAIRAECVTAYGADLSNFSNRNFVLYMTEIAKDLGLSRPVFKVENTPIGIRGTVTGLKDSERGRITVRVINLVGESSIMTLYLMASSVNFQTPEMAPFVQSVRKRRSFYERQTNLDASLGADELADNAEATGGTCVAIGPLTNMEDADSVRSLYERQGIRTELRTDTRLIFVGYLVRIRNVSNRSAGNAMLSKLRNGGLVDAYLVRTSEGGLNISLGLFGDPQKAEEIEARARRLNLFAEIVPRASEGTVYFVDVGLPSGWDASAMIEKFGDKKVIQEDVETCTL